MGNLRRKLKVAWDDREPIELLTSARDILNASNYEASTEPAAQTFALLYAALVRLGHELPPYDEWLDLVDDVQDVGTVVEVAGPTRPEASDGVLLRSPASPEPTGDPGLIGMTTAL